MLTDSVRTAHWTQETGRPGATALTQLPGMFCIDCGCQGYGGQAWAKGGGVGTGRGGHHCGVMDSQLVMVDRSWSLFDA
jgi:hypothetical protein